MKPCSACGSETVIKALASFSGEDGPVTVTVDGMPAVTCGQNHKRFLYAEFAPALVDFTAEPEKIAPQPAAVKRGFIKKRFHCSSCGTELPANSTTTSERSLEVNLKKAPSFIVMVRVALYRCSKCGREQPRSNDELAASTLRAMARAFRAADVHPDH